MGDVTKLLLDTWSKNVGVDIEKQIRKWANEKLMDNLGPTPYKFK